VLVLALIRAWRLLPDPEIRTLTLAGEDMADAGVQVGMKHTAGVSQAHAFLQYQDSHFGGACDANFGVSVFHQI